MRQTAGTGLFLAGVALLALWIGAKGCDPVAQPDHDLTSEGLEISHYEHEDEGRAEFKWKTKAELPPEPTTLFVSVREGIPSLRPPITHPPRVSAAELIPVQEIEVREELRPVVDALGLLLGAEQEDPRREFRVDDPLWASLLSEADAAELEPEGGWATLLFLEVERRRRVLDENIVFQETLMKGIETADSEPPSRSALVETALNLSQQDHPTSSMAARYAMELAAYAHDVDGNEVARRFLEHADDGVQQDALGWIADRGDPATMTERERNLLEKAWVSGQGRQPPRMGVASILARSAFARGDDGTALAWTNLLSREVERECTAGRANEFSCGNARGSISGFKVSTLLRGLPKTTQRRYLTSKAATHAA